MALLRYEFKKFIKPHVLVLLFLCSMLDIFGIYVSIDRYYDPTIFGTFRDIYTTYLAGPITQEKIDFVTTETKRLTTGAAEVNPTGQLEDSKSYTGNLFTDMLIFNFFILPRMEYSVNYYYENQRLVSKAYDNLDFYLSVDNRYMQKVNAQIVKTFDHRAIDQFYDLLSMKNLVYYDFSGLIVLLLGILVITPVFFEEHDTGMDRLLPSYHYGGKNLKRVKILFTLIIGFGLSLWFFLLDLIGYALFSNLEGFSAPVFALMDFRFTPLNTTIMVYLVLIFLLRVVGISSFLFITLFASAYFRKSIYVFAVGMGTIIIVFLSQFTPSRSFNLIELFNPALLIKGRNLLMDYAVQNILNFPVNSVYAALFINVTLIVVLCILITRKANI